MLGLGAHARKDYCPGTDRMINSSAQLRQITLALGLVFGAAGCSTISDLDPTGLISDSSGDTAAASQFPDQTAAPTASDQEVGTTPDLASLPARPPAAPSADQQQTAQSLASDGAQARYSADALRGGTEAAAPPPAASDTPPPSVAQRVLGGTDAPPTASDAPPTASDVPPTAAPPQVAAAAPPPAAAPAAAPPMAA